MTRRRKLLLAALGAVLLAGMVGAAMFAFSAARVADDLAQARDGLLAARAAVSERDPEAAQAAMDSAASSSAAAAAATDGLLWHAAAAVPLVGATPATVQAIATSLDQAVTGIAPAMTALDSLRPSSLVGAGGKVDVAAVSATLPTITSAQTAVERAFATLAAAPSPAAGDNVIPQVDEARAELATQLSDLEDTLDNAVSVVTIVPELLGADGPKRYFFAITNPNEARGTGGFLGTWAIVRAEGGKLRVEEVGSNSDLPTLTRFPKAIDDDFRARYGDEAKLISGMNLSPHFPNAAQLWLRSWQDKTGERLDGAISADVVALGELVTATGREVPLPDGGSLTGAELTDFAVAGIYEQFPEPVESVQRKEYQEEVARAAVEVITRGGSVDATASALTSAIGEGRLLAWVRDSALQEQIIATPLGGSLAVRGGPKVSFVALNSSASKLDTYLARGVIYDAGQCADSRNMVRSTVQVTLTNALPDGELPAYVISQATVGRDGPINSTLAQLHLPNGAEVLEVEVDGEPAFYSPFTEQGRPSLVLDLDLPPNEPVTLRVLFREPRSGAQPVATEQPLVLDQDTEVGSRPC